MCVQTLQEENTSETTGRVYLVVQEGIGPCRLPTYMNEVNVMHNTVLITDYPRASIMAYTKLDLDSECVCAGYLI